MTFGKIVAVVFFGSFLAVAIAGAKPSANATQEASVTIRHEASSTPASTNDRCVGLKMSILDTAGEMGGISSRAHDNGVAMTAAGQAGDLARMREVSRSARRDVWALRSVVQTARLQISEAIENGCVTRAQTVDSQQHIDQMSDVGDSTLAMLDRFDSLVGQ